VRVNAAAGERGAVAVIVGIVITVLFGFAGLAVDLGNLWESRRHLVTATDAAALAAAQAYGMGDNGCGSFDDDYVGFNYADASVTGCTATGLRTSRGSVTVAAEAPVDFKFAEVLDVVDPEVRSGTTAGWFIPSGMPWLRPFALCKDHPAVKAWIASPWGKSEPVHVTYSKNANDDCGDASGNWGVLDFDGGSNGTGDTREWTENGYREVVHIGDEIVGDPGAFSEGISTGLDALIAGGGLISIPLFDSVTASGNSSSFHIYGFISAEVLGYRTTGQPDDRYLEIRFLRMVVSGECCATGPDTGTFAVHICDVDGRFGPAHCN
jgi:putative Flp pilus-assembly TadE/G-like protein